MDSWIVAFWFFLPAGLANMAPVLANKIPGWNRWKTPLDLGGTFRGGRILGDNKSMRGVVSGVILATIIATIENLTVHSHLLPTTLWWPILGGLMGIGALLGDAGESFFKRRISRKPGQSWFPFDQTDYIVGGLLVGLPFLSDYHHLTALIIRVFILYFGLHLSSVYIGFKLKLKDAPI
jgi:CDP-2,3-bis-(O-geranylgeranyl)-sn-glycerol synthase